MPLSPSLTLSSSLRRRSAAALAIAVAAATATACGAPDVRPAMRVFSAAIETTPQYQPATLPCDPGDSFSKPGPIAFEQLLLATYGPASVGITRACDGSKSEHNEGRALDWGMDYANSVQRQHGQTVIDWLRETDTSGRANAVARRLGIQYFIWNKQMYGSWNNFAPSDYPCDGTPTGCHVNHIHISFTWSGAQQLTSFWQAGPLPAARVGTSQAVSAQAAAPMVAPVSLLPGVSYTIVASGTYRFGAATTQVADAMCSLKNGAWSTTSGRVSMFGTNDLKLAVDNTSAWVPTINNGQGCNTVDHRYRLSLPLHTGLDLYAVVQDPIRSDNLGALNLNVVAAG